MKEVTKILLAGAGAGAVVTQLLNVAASAWFDRPFNVGGEMLLPALIVLIGYIGWKLSETYFYETKYPKIYKKGYDDGLRIHSHTFIIPETEGEIIELTDHDAA